ncbi:hypothetical protein SprV_0301346200 [Sparganum proliferum]
MDVLDSNTLDPESLTKKRKLVSESSDLPVVPSPSSRGSTLLDDDEGVPRSLLKDNLPLDRALQLARRAEDTDDLSHSEPTELGRGMRKKFVRQLTSDDDVDEEVAAQKPRHENPLTGWPTPPRILHSENTPWWRDSSQPTPPRANQYAVLFLMYT